MAESYGVTYRGQALGVRTSNMDWGGEEKNTMCKVLFACLNFFFETGPLYLALNGTHYTDNACLELTD